MSKDIKKRILSLLKEQEGEALGVVGSPSSSFEAIADIKEAKEESKLLGEVTCFQVKENDDAVLVLGQITGIETKNRWHEEPSFKGIIKRHGSLPNLSGTADNRIAKVSVQSSFILKDQSEPQAHKLANSPSTGVPVCQVNNEIMNCLMEQYRDKGTELVCLGRAYDTGVQIPFWLRHFGKPDSGGVGEAYHIGIFGRTGSGKTHTATNMILGYAKNSKNMSILILDPQEEFFNNNTFEERVKKCGMEYKKLKVPDDVVLPPDASLFSSMLLRYGFIHKAFDTLKTYEKEERMADAIKTYIQGRMWRESFDIGQAPDRLLKDMLKRFLKKKEQNYMHRGNKQIVWSFWTKHIASSAHTSTMTRLKD